VIYSPEKYLVIHLPLKIKHRHIGFLIQISEEYIDLSPESLDKNTIISLLQ